MAKTTEPKRAQRKQVMAGEQAAPAAIARNSYDPKTREFEAVLSTGAAVVRVPWFDEPFIEKLSMEPGAVRMARFESGQAPILDNHARWSVRDSLLGVIVRAELRDGQLVYRGRISARPDLEGLRTDVGDGVVVSQSCGYFVHKYRDVTMPGDKMRTLEAIDWEPVEASFVMVPAEVEQGVRGAWMPNESRELAGVRARELEHVLTIESREASEGTMDPELEQPQKDTGAGQGGTRTAVNTPPPAQTPPAAPPADPERIRAEERERITQIRALATKHGLDEAFVAEHTRSGSALPQVREAVLAAIEQRQAKTSIATHVPASARGAQDEDETLVRGIAEQLEVRANVLDPAKMTENGKRFRGTTLIEMGRDILQAHGINPRGLTKDQVFDQLLRASQSRSMHGTGDFAEITSAVASKSMRKAYDAQPQRWRDLARPNNAPDFKAMKRVQLSQIGALQEVKEHGEIRRTTLSDTSESYALKTYANIIGFSRQLMINDDMGALSRIARMFGAAAAEMENQVMWTLITGNPTMGDSVALFHATHNNLVDAGSGAGVLDETGLKNMRGKLRTQKDFKGNTVQVEPVYLIVPTTLEVAALKHTSVIVASSASNVNVFGGSFQKVIVDAHLDSASTAFWYVAGSPDQYDLLEYSTLEGASGPQISERIGFETDGFDMRVIHDFAGAVLEFVSIAKSTGV